MLRGYGQTARTQAALRESQRSLRPRKAAPPADSIGAARAPPIPCRCPLALRSAPSSCAERPAAPADRCAASPGCAQSCLAVAHIRILFLLFSHLHLHLYLYLDLDLYPSHLSLCLCSYLYLFLLRTSPPRPYTNFRHDTRRARSDLDTSVPSFPHPPPGTLPRSRATRPEFQETVAE